MSKVLEVRGERLAPVVLVILDGWGEAPAESWGNAIARAGLSVLPALMARDPHALLQASGAAVGLPEGVMGNSEVGHLTIGAGRIVLQDLVRISRACADGTLAALPELRRTFEALRRSGGRLHHLGLCSDAGVHSHLSHLQALVLAAAEAGIERQLVHCFMDGRDTAPDAGLDYLRELTRFLSGVRGAEVASLMGRYWAMDRDTRWDRTERAYAALVRGQAPAAPSAEAAMEASYAAGVSDEFVEPVLLTEDATLRDGDAALFFNFRADRARQLTLALTEPDFDRFPIEGRPKLARFLCMTVYREDLDLPVLFRREHPRRVLGEVFAEAGWEQMRLAETEKYAHVTYFMNGGREEVFRSEERVLIPSPRVATYDLTPAMSAETITDRAVEWIRRGGPRLLVLNFANADMVGHTGDIAAAMEACRVVDRCLGRIVQAVDEEGGLLVVTADHGNAECMLDERGMPMTAHTTLPVPVVLHDAGKGHGRRLRDGGLRDVAPTLLRLVGLPVPAEMSGSSLVEPPE